MGSRYVQVLGIGKETRRIPPPVGIRVHGPKGLDWERNHSSTGKSKGMIPNPIDKITAKRSRSYKTTNYPSWCRRYTGVNKPKRGGAA